MLPHNLAAPFQRHLQKVKAQYEEDVESGVCRCVSAACMKENTRTPAREWSWQWVFPSTRLSLDPRAKEKRSDADDGSHRGERIAIGG